MAMIQMVDCDRASSSQINIVALAQKVGCPKKTASIINLNFDGLVLTFSNVLRKGAFERELHIILEYIDIPIYAFGMGIQDPLPLGDSTSIHPFMRKLLLILQEKAKVFGVRGLSTEKWLHSIDISNAIALGCPSILAYPRNVLSIKSKESYDNILSAGRLVPAKGKESRTHKLIEGFINSSVSYVFQEELFHYVELLDIPNIYDEATQTLDRESIVNYLINKCGLSPQFKRYYAFTNVSAWRQACSTYDAYIGDRIHGGIAALQVGVPAVILYNDARVKELASYHGIPHCTLDEFKTYNAQEILSRYLSHDNIELFLKRYIVTVDKFNKIITQSGLPLINRDLGNQ
jgi:hypothetical protein